MKLKKSSLLLFSVVVIFFLEYHFFYLIEIPNFYIRALFGRFSRLGIGFLAVVFWLFASKECVPKSINFLCLYAIVAFVLLSAFSFLARPSQGVFYVFGATSQYLCLLYAKPIYLLLFKYDKEKSIIKWICWIVLCWYVVSILQSFVFLNGGEFFLKEFFSNDYILVGTGRLDNVRLVVFSLGVFVPLYSFSKLLDNFYSREKMRMRVKIAYLLIITLGTYCIIFLQQGRSEVISYLFSLFVMFLLHPARRSYTVVKPIAVLAGVFAIGATGIVSGLLESFSSTSVLYLSTYKRVAEYEYFLKAFFHNPIFGHGLYYSDYAQMYQSSMGVMWNNDVGLIGMLGSSGLIGTGLFIYILRRLRLGVKKLKQKNGLIFIEGLLGYLLLSSLTTLHTDPACIMLLPVVFAYNEYQLRKSGYIEGKRRTIGNGSF